MSLFDTMTETAKRILDELNCNEMQADVTGKVWLDLDSEAVWFQVEDDTRTTNWVTLDLPEFAAHGETLVVAADENDMHHFIENREPEGPSRIEEEHEYRFGSDRL